MNSLHAFIEYYTTHTLTHTQTYRDTVAHRSRQPDSTSMWWIIEERMEQTRTHRHKNKVNAPHSGDEPQSERGWGGSEDHLMWKSVREEGLEENLCEREKEQGKRKVLRKFWPSLISVYSAPKFHVPQNLYISWHTDKYWLKNQVMDTFYWA